MAEVVVAVVSWNTRDLLLRGLRSLRSAVDGGLAEVWVVDNGSTDGSAEAARRECEWATVVDAGENLGFGRAVNLVAARTESTWIAPANADVAVSPDALHELLAAARRFPQAGALAPRLRLRDGSAQHSVYRFPTLGFALAFNLGIYRLHARLGDRMCLEGWWNPNRPRPVDWAVGAFLLVSRQAWNEVGGFGERQWMYAEDLDLGWRLARAGWQTRYVPSAVIEHEQSASTRQVWGEAADVWIISTYSWLRDRRGRRIAVLIATVNVIGAAARWGLFGLAAIVRPAWRWRRAWARAWARRHLRGLAHVLSARR